MSDDPDRTQPAPPPSGNRSTGTPGKAKGWQPPSTAELQELLPQYEITTLLGRGGMGAVYQGTQLNLDRPVAIKILPPEMDEDDGANYAERFKNEARSMAKLNHPGIVAVYDFGETANGILYIVMEFIAGTDVQKMVTEQGRLHSAHALAITAHVCDALQYAHDRRIVHRDIKPANIMVGYDGVVKVADFGLAKMSKAGESGLTRSGMAMGTLHYMAPEALMLGSSVDHRADIYAVGVMLYFMLTGKLPQGMFDLPSLQVPGLDPRYDGIITKALRDDRDIRYQSTAELRRDLDGILTQPVVKAEPDATKAQPTLPTEVRPQRPDGHRPAYMRKEQADARVERRSSPLLWAAVLVLGGIVLWTQWHRSPAPSVTTNATSSETAAVTPALSPAVPPANSPVAPITATAPMPPSATPEHPPNLASTKILRPAVWHDLLQAPPADTFNFKSGNATSLSPEGRAGDSKVRLRAISPVFALAKFALKDCILRARFGGGWQNAPYIFVRFNGQGWFISSNMSDSSTALRKVQQAPSGANTSTDFAKNAGVTLPRGSPFEVELKVVGNHYTLSMDGTVVTEGSDSAYAEGAVGFRMEQDTVIERLEVMPLDSTDPKAAATTPATKSATGWRSLLDEKPEIITKLGITAPVNGWRAMQKGFQPLIESPNAAIRIKARSYLVLIARWSGSLAGSEHGYRTAVGGPPGSSTRLSSGWITSATTINGQIRPTTYTPSGNQPVLPFNAGAEYELELRSFGDRLTVLLNGKVQNEFASLTHPGKWFAIETIDRSEFSSLEWMPLNAEGLPLSATITPSVASPPSSPERQALEQQYLTAIAKQVTRVVTAYARSIIPSYNAALERAAKSPEISSADAAALKTEIQRLISTNTVPDTDAADTSPAITALRTTYRNAVESFRAEKTAPLKAIYDQQLKELDSSPAAVTSPPAASKPARATKDAPFTNSLGMKFVPVPGTKVLFGIHETRRKDFETFCSETGYSSAYWHSQPNGLLAGHEADHPVVGVSWNDAQSFCSWLTQKTGITHRLPTDHEWSCAVGVGDEEAKTPNATPEQLNLQIQNEYPWGRSFPPPDHSGNLADSECGKMFSNQTVLFSYNDGFATTAPVMSFKPNAFGIYDLEGNVSEWCSDLHSDKMQSRVFRGGNWLASAPNILLSSARMRNTVIAHVPILGFRVVLETAP